MIQDNLDFMMRDYFMAIVTYFDWKCDYRTFFITCSKLLNYLELTNHFKSKEEKAYAAGILIQQYNMGTNYSIPQETAEKLRKVLTFDKEQVADGHIFAIDEVYEIGHAMQMKKREEFANSHPNVEIPI